MNTRTLASVLLLILLLSTGTLSLQSARAQDATAQTVTDLGGIVQLSPPEEAEGFASQELGTPSDIDGDTIIIGALFDDNDAGAAYVYTRTDGEWAFEQKLVADDREGRDLPSSGDRFGVSVAVDGDTAMVGAFFDNDQVGSVYVFERTNGTWTQTQRLSLPENTTYTNPYGFGSWVELENDTAAIWWSNFGDTAELTGGVVSLFTLVNGEWTYQQDLIPTDRPTFEVSSLAPYGSIANEGNRIAISPWVDTNVSPTIYTYVREGEVWNFDQEFVPPVDTSESYMDTFVRLDGNTLSFIGRTSYGVDFLDTYEDGVFIYTRDETGWNLQQNVNLPEELSSGRLSRYADVSSDLLAVMGTDVNNDPTVYFFTHSSDTWTYSNLIALPEFTRVQIDGNTALFTNYIVELDNLPQTPEIAVQGNGADIFDGATVPNPETDTDFGRVNVNSGIVEKTFTIQNSAFASGDLTLSDVTISGDHADDFTVTADPTSPVAPDSETAFTVTFDPSAPGVRTAQVNIANNDSDENPFTFVVQGVGATLDVNLDGTITAADAIFVINRLGNPATGDDAIADVDGDSDIDSDDVNAVVGALGQPTP